jgi:predicted membrane-bound spermidine synthase
LRNPTAPDWHGHARIFLASFLVLFLQVALIRWMPAYVRLLSYFSNFILLACFLGIGLGCLLAPSRRHLFGFFPAIQAAVVAAVYFLRLEVGVGAEGSIYFSSGTSDEVVRIESTMLLPLVFLIVAALFTALAQRMAREMTTCRPLVAYTVNLVGSLAGVAVFGVLSWFELPPTVWFGVALAAAAPLLATADPGRPLQSWTAVAANLVLLVVSLMIVHLLARDSLWSPYYRITVTERDQDVVVNVNNVFHQSMAPLEHKEYFYEWPYTALPGKFDEVLVLGAGSGTDVAAALRHGAKHVDAVEIDPTIQHLGRQYHPDKPYSDPRVTLINDDARHFLRTTNKTYDLVVFALIDSLTLQSSFSGVRLESYMFTEESFRAVRDRLAPDGLLVIYNYFREPWLVDRLANTAAAAFGAEPRVHVHEARAYLGILLAGPRVASLPDDLAVPDRVAMYGMRSRPTPARLHQRDGSIEPATDDWPFLYMRDRHVPRHYLGALALILVVSIAAVVPVVRHQAGTWSWQFFLLGAGFMLLETKSIIQFALLWGSTWVVASLAIASVLVMALAANFVVARREVTRPGLVGVVLVGLLAVNYALPVGRLGFESRAIESLVYAVLMFSPILCAGLLFGSAIKRSTSVARDYGTNLLGAMVGGTAEYLSLVTGFQMLLVVIALCYAGAVIARRLEGR